ncbi:hypothetical protein [Ktedonospora formicarum]|uniref:Uncharacterized protein n=1 Tax=Ktedonospora formicarum TaxID=2778364 RepID=A0A8J3HXL8_9CHLR|nr:hypothetical protein [Ktedonospora formicarum]GHO45614.1 hypothetical protein KSX_37770 [Ktedonospora formicarum]
MDTNIFMREARNVQPDLPPPHLLQWIVYKAVSSEELEDQNAPFRLSVLEALHETLTPADRILVRFILEQEIIYHEQFAGMSDSLRLCGFLLSLLARLDDVRLLWEAKITNFDTMCGFDIQLLVGAGVSATLAYLQHIQEDWAQEAKEYIEECQQAGDFDRLDQYRATMQRYFRNTV